MPFTQNAVTVKEVDARHWSTQHPLSYRGARQYWVIPRGFVTDFASVPRFLTWLVPILGVYTKAVILHDWFCKYGIQAGKISARDADGVLRRCCEEAGTPFLTRWCIWTGVRWGALFNPVRRAGWWRDAPKVVLISIPLLIVLPAVIAIWFVYAVVWLIERLWRVGDWVWETARLRRL